MQVCDLCGGFHRTLINFYERWACSECLQAYGEYYGDPDPYLTYMYGLEGLDGGYRGKLEKSFVAIEELICDYEDLSINEVVKSLNGPIYQKFSCFENPTIKSGFLDVQIEFID